MTFSYLFLYYYFFFFSFCGYENIEEDLFIKCAVVVLITMFSKLLYCIKVTNRLYTVVVFFLFLELMLLTVTTAANFLKFGCFPFYLILLFFPRISLMHNYFSSKICKSYCFGLHILLTTFFSSY